MKNLLLLIIAIAIYGCSNSNDEAPPITQSLVTIEQHCASDSVVLPKTNTIIVNGSTDLTIVQPAFLWFPKWKVIGGTLIGGVDIFHATVVPTSETCTVIVEWYQVDNPPPPPNTFG